MQQCVNSEIDALRKETLSVFKLSFKLSLILSQLNQDWRVAKG